ncbi:MAG: LysR family transcriptional regulator [Rhodospirillales bacterium]|mgnify:CR=1 FL=1|jgi:DNA-binding transcriptional LysR family regulator|nr:LysR family transcriptional regulator [Rhodospirillales bacterium]
MDTLNSIKAFTKVVDSGSFTGAAKALGQTKSAVSKHVAQLEEHLGARLLNRTTRAVSPTEEGLAFHSRCLRILSDLEDAERSVADLHSTPRGTLRINAPVNFGGRYLADAVADFMKTHSELNVELDLNDRLVDVVDEGFDVVIRITSMPDSSLFARKISPFRRVICATPEYWRKHGKPEHPSELTNHNCLLYTYLLTGNEWSFDGPDGTFNVKITGSFKANNGDVLVSAASNGLGVLAAPTFIAHDAVKEGILEPVLMDYTETKASIYAVYPHSRHLSAKVRLFVDFLIERYSPEPPWDTI